MWVLRDGAPTRIPVVTGATDGQDTEVVEGLALDDEVIVASLEPEP